MNLTLHPRQGEAFLSPATEILYGGAAGGGKSHLMRVAALAWCIAVPGLNVYLFRRTSPDLWHNHMEGAGSFLSLLGDWMKAGVVKLNVSKGYFEFCNGSRINLCHCQYEKDIYNYQGAEIHALMVDELTQWPQGMYAFLRSRVRLGGLHVPDDYQGLFPRVLCSANPGGIGHNWVKAAFIDAAAPSEVFRASASEGGLLRQYIPALLQDNPTLMENDPDYASRLEGLGSEHLVKAMLHGDWDIVAGGAVDDVWSRGRHVVEPFEIPSSWRIDRSFDWGSSKPFSVGWWAESDGTEIVLSDGSKRSWPRGTLFRVAELYGWNGRPNEGCRMLAVEVARKIKAIEAKVFPGRTVAPGPADSSIYQAENGVSIADDMARAGVRWTEADKRPGSRKTGLEALRKRLKAGLRSPMEAPGLFAFSTCSHFIRTVPVLPRDQRDPDDVDSAAEDHVYDETRYRLTAKPRGMNLIQTNI